MTTHELAEQTFGNLEMIRRLTDETLDITLSSHLAMFKTHKTAITMAMAAMVTYVYKQRHQQSRIDGYFSTL